VRRYDGGLVGVIGRSILPKEKRDAMNASNRYTKKYYVYGNFSRSRYLFGSHFIDDNDIDSLFMVEGTLDVIRMHDLGYENTVGVLGSEVSDRQMSKALDYNVPIYLMLDGDSAGKKGMEKAYEQYKKQGSLKVIELDKVTKYLKDKGDDDIIIKDPDDFESKDQVEFAKECAIDEISRKLSSLNK
jgi:DNA primase